MGRYLYTIKDKNTGNVLFVGGEGAAARFLDCDTNYLCSLARRTAVTGKQTTYGDKEVMREWVETVVACQCCGIEMKNVRPNQLYCPECAKKRKNSRNSKGVEMQCLQEDGTMISVDEKQREMQKRCHGCVYFGGEKYMNASCNYLFIVGHSRGCPGGDNCTKRKTK